MSLSARRLTGGTPVVRMKWERPEMVTRPGPGQIVPIVPPVSAPPRAVELRDQLLAPPLSERMVIAEREAFAKGYAEGERGGRQQAAVKTEVMVRNLLGTIDEIGKLRAGVMRKTERDVVRLAISMAERIVRREVEVDRELLTAMARVAIERLGENVTATVHLNPADYDAATGGKTTLGTGNVQVVSDPQIAPGGCLVRSALGVIDVGIDAQVRELARGLIGDDHASGQDSDGGTAHL